ncbi:MAG: hypothetical protein QXO15_08965 [Nitrososphaerota archaeon]
MIILVLCGICIQAIQAYRDSSISTSTIVYTQTTTTVITQNITQVATIVIPKVTTVTTTIWVGNLTYFTNLTKVTYYTTIKTTYTNYTLITITTLKTYTNETVITHTARNQTSTNRTLTDVVVGMHDYIAKQGDYIIIDIFVNGSENIAGGIIELSFNNSVVMIHSILEGDFGQPVVFINNPSGVARIAVAAPTSIGKSSSVLARVRLFCHEQGYTRLTIKFAELNDVRGNTILPKTKDGSVMVFSLKGDLNGNGKLDTGDATLILRMVVGLEPVNMLGDMNGNGRIDTGDATILLRKIVGLE